MPLFGVLLPVSFIGRPSGSNRGVNRWSPIRRLRPAVRIDGVTNLGRSCFKNLEPGAQIENVEEAHEQEVQVEIPEAEPVDIHVQLVMVQIYGDGVAEDNQPNHGGAEDNQGAEPGTERNESKWCYILTLFMVGCIIVMKK
ncbi:BnaC09g24120D [Brassica napus]|uniref:Uncharacterized protein n=2 Tax=Brassica TaxID=3705 RepID=A0A3P6E6X5_BRAOL|nr:unnamed protein product [Brassica napus]CDY13244.1 BnaC09g24120D [Brassica napus]VDD31054.1 unnamed protein product [Brassica oleracea]